MKKNKTLIIGGVAVGILLLLYLRRRNSSSDQVVKSAGAGDAGASGGGGAGGGGGMFGRGGMTSPNDNPNYYRPLPPVVVNNTLRPLVSPRPMFARPQVSYIDSRPTTSPVSNIAPSVAPSVAPNIPNIPTTQASVRSNFLTFDGGYTQSRAMDFGGIVE
jgi:hypothetical protein